MPGQAVKVESRKAKRESFPIAVADMSLNVDLEVREGVGTGSNGGRR